MGHARLSDMAILAIERDITVDLDRTVKQFSKEHKDSRIYLESFLYFQHSFKSV
jgi:hypothetical protein